ncbi:MAG TPA: hypothetical protein VI485_27260 [Vicinamibacterales bacterium]|nr:hypothetical protein [Vicinamibacterales bacterium]
MKAPTGTQILVAVTIVVVVAAVVVGIVMLGPPAEARARRIDDQRVRDLQSMGAGIISYWMVKRRLPTSLEEVTMETGNVSISTSRDPVTGTPYRYRVLDDKTYELCATFDRASISPTPADIWAHGSGMRCFTRRAGDLRE